MYNAVNPDRYGLKDNFISGVDEFVEMAMARPNFLAEGGIRFPCANCKCIDLMTPRDVKYHLYKNGFQPNYYVWTEHGEVNPNSKLSGHSRSENVDYEDQLAAMNHMVHDVIRPFTDDLHM